MVSDIVFHDQRLIVGRERERAELHHLVDAAMASNGRLLLVGGEAGIGKTTLVRDLARHARKRACLVLSGGCYDLTTTPPYGPWREALQSYQPAGDQPAHPAWFDDPQAMQEVGSQTALFEEARRFLTELSTHQPLVIVLEDLHWSDPASLAALRYLGRTLAGTPCLLVVTYRDDELTRLGELYQLLPLLVHDCDAWRLYLQRLDPGAVHELVEHRYTLDAADATRLAAHLVARSDGNPFFATEILQGLEEEQVLAPTASSWQLGDLDNVHVPALVRQVLDRRLGRLTSATQATLRTAAVIGQTVPLELWQEVTGLGQQELDRVIREALEARVLDDGVGALLRFHHALVRDALYESLLISERRLAHRQVGEVLAESVHPDPDEVAHHFLEAGDERSIPWLMRAGVRAEGSYARTAAIAHYQTVNELLQSKPETAQARAWLLFQIGHLLRFIDRDRGIAFLEAAARMARQTDAPVLAAFSLHIHGLLRCFQGNLGTGLLEMERAIATLQQATEQQVASAQQAVISLFPEEIFIDPRSTSGSLLFKIGRLRGVGPLTQLKVFWLSLAGRFREARAIGEQLVQRVAAATDDQVLIQDACRDAYCGLFTAADWLGCLEQARRWQALALDAYQATGNYTLIGYVQCQLVEHLLAYQTDRLSECRDIVAVAIAAEERAGGTWGGYPANTFALPLDMLEGRWEDAWVLARMTFGDHSVPAQDVRRWVFGALAPERSDAQLAAAMRTDLDNLFPNGPATEPGHCDFAYALTLQRLAAGVALDAGDLETGRTWIAAHDRWLEWSGAVRGRAEAQLLWARYHRAAGDLDTARQHAEQALEQATNPRQPLALIAVQRFLGQLALDTERYDAAVDHLGTSLTLAEQCEAPYESARTLLAMAELAMRTSDPDAARRHLRDSRQICQQLGAERSLERIAELERCLDRSASGPLPHLSTREVEVLELVATGMTNAEVGEVLYISHRTVAQHLRSIYNKLGVDNRTAAVTRWTELQSR